MRVPLLVVTFDLDEKGRDAVAADLGGKAAALHLTGLDDNTRREALANATVLLAQNTGTELRPGEPALVRGARLVQFLSAGVDFIPLRDLPAEVPIAGNGGAYAEPMAEHALAMALAAAKRLLLEHAALARGELFVAGHDWGGPVAFSLAAQRREAVRRVAVFDVPVPGDGTPVMFSNRWHHGLHWERDLPEELTAGREDVYLRFFYRTWGARPDAIAEDAQLEYLRAYRQPGAMRAGFEIYRATPQDVADNEAFLAQGGKLRKASAGMYV
jgi:pimeloyl-ACP methyl ester carboxylesterase